VPPGVSELPAELKRLALFPPDRPFGVADVNADGRLEIVVQWRLVGSRTNVRTVVLRWEMGVKRLRPLLENIGDGVLFTDADRDGLPEALPYYLESTTPVFLRPLVWKDDKYQPLPRLPRPVARLMAPVYRKQIGAFLLSGRMPMLEAYVKTQLLSGDNPIEAYRRLNRAMGELEEVERQLSQYRREMRLLRADVELAMGVKRPEEVFEVYRQIYREGLHEGFETAEGFAAARVARRLVEQGRQEEALDWLHEAEEAEGRVLDRLWDYVLTERTEKAKR
jgi:hypothetical protein